MTSEAAWWNTVRLNSNLIREAFAEFIGTFVLTLVGNGVLAVVVFSRFPFLGTIVGPLAWSFALLAAICISGGVSGAHVNPAATLAFATIGRFPWKKVLVYMLAQYLGSFVSSAVLFGVYKDAFDAFDGGSRYTYPHVNATSHIFSCFPQPFVSIGTCFFDQVVSTGLLLMAVCAVTDDRNMGIPKSSSPVFISFCLASIMFAFGYNCMAPLNPARDLSPRIFTAMAGWGIEVFSVRDYNWFWVPVVGPHVGGIVGAWVYRILIEMHWPPSSYDLPVNNIVDPTVQMKYVKSNDIKP